LAYHREGEKIPNVVGEGNMIFGPIYRPLYSSKVANYPIANYSKIPNHHIHNDKIVPRFKIYKLQVINYFLEHSSVSSEDRHI
jgi:hypothetical protein